MLALLSAAGGIFGRKKQKYMDPGVYRQTFGPAAIGKRTQELVNQIVNSPYGQKLMQDAAEQGQGLQTGLNKAAAESGFGPAGGAQSGASDFGVAAAPQAVSALQRGITSGLTSSAMPIAQSMVQREGDLAIGNMAAQNAEPTMLGRLGAGAATAMSGMKGKPMDWAELLKKLQKGSAGGLGGGFDAPVQAVA